MRIVGGAWRGRPLASVGKGDPVAHLRPTSDRVRESLFNLLAHAHGDPVTGAHVLDVFAGTGALGFEALSRGAASAVFLESGRAARRLITENIRLLDAGDRASLVTRDALRPGAPSGDPATLVFLDPPYGKGLGEKALGALEAWIAPGALIVWEESGPVQAPDGYEAVDSRQYGQTWVSVLERVAG